MIIEEGSVITLGNDAEYILLHDLGEMDGYDGKFFFSVGVTKNDKLNIDDITFLQIRNTENGPTARNLEKNTEAYAMLSCLEITSILIDSLPGYKDKFVSEFKKIEALEESSK